MADSSKIHDPATDEFRQFLSEQGVSLDPAQTKALIEFIEDAGGVDAARQALDALDRLAA